MAVSKLHGRFLNQLTFIILIIFQSIFVCEFSLAADCNNNGVEDSVEISEDETLDCDSDGILDSCEATVLSSQLPIGFRIVEDVDIPTPADMNRDGVTDLVVRNNEDRGLSVYLGQTDGTFIHSVTLPYETYIDTILVFDFNGDQHLDIVTSDRLGQNRFLNFITGDGTGQVQKYQELEVDFQATLSVAQDFNGDTGVDFLLIDEFSDTAKIFLNDLAGGFGDPIELPDVESPWVGSAFGGDLDGDGKAEALTFSGTSKLLKIYHHVEAQTFVEIGSLALPDGLNTLSLADYTGDGTLDFLASGHIEGAIIAIGNGDKTFQDFVKIENLYHDGTLYPLDLDADGIMEFGLFAFAVSHSLVIYQSIGGLDFKPTEPSLSSLLHNRGMFTTQLDDDPLLELVIMNKINFGPLSLSTLNYSEQAIEETDCNLNQLLDRCEFETDKYVDVDKNFRIDACEQDTTHRFTDCDLDGFDDLAAISEGRVSDCNSNGVPDSCEVPTENERNAFKMNSMRVIREGLNYQSKYLYADFNGDGEEDLLFNRTTAQSFWIRYAGRNNFEVVGPFSKLYYVWAALDVDGDGDVDILVSNPDNEYLTLLNDGEGEFSESDSIPIPEGLLRWAKTGDFDGDGLDEVLFQNRTQEIVFPPGIRVERYFFQILNFSNGSPELGSEFEIPDYPDEFTIGDWNQDGLDDILAHYRSESRLRSFLATEDGGFVEGPFVNSILGYDGILTADVNSDGLDDVVFPSRTTTTLLGSPNGFFETMIQSRTANSREAHQIYDVNGDGHLDIITNNNNTFSVLEGDGTGKFYEKNIYYLGGLSLFPFIDDNGDGVKDVLLRDGNTESLAVIKGFENGTFGTAVVPGSFFPTEFNEAGAVIQPSSDDEDQKVKLIVAVEGEDRYNLLAEYDLYQGPNGPVFVNERMDTMGVEFKNPYLIDLNGDGLRDIITGYPDESFNKIYLFDPETNSYFFSQEFDSRGIFTGNVDQDGDIDLFSLLGPYRFQTYRNLGTGKFSGPITQELPFYSAGRAVGDFDGDGRDDVALYDTDTAELKIFSGGEDGLFDVLGDPSMSIDLGFESVSHLFASHLNQDELLDLVAISALKDFRFEHSARFVSLLNQGDDTFKIQQNTNLGSRVGSAVLGSTRGDGIQDLAVYLKDSEKIQIFSGSGNGGFSNSKIISSLRSILRIEFSDMTMDGLPELIIYDRDRMAYYLNETTPTASDCNRNGVPDSCDLASGHSEDANENGIPDACEDDCDDDGVPDDFAIQQGIAPDCNENGIVDSCEIALDSSIDINEDGIIDACVPDCDEDGVSDEDEISNGTDQDCDSNGIPDSCQISMGESADINSNGIPDACELDCNENNLPDSYEIETGLVTDCDLNQKPDTCDLIIEGIESDLDSNGVLDRCQEDCDEDGFPDTYEIEFGLDSDCNENGILDRCEIKEGSVEDCNLNGIPDSCDIENLGIESDKDQNGILDECEGGLQIPGDANQDGVLDISDSVWLLTYLFLGHSGALPCGSQETLSPGGILLLDWQGDGLVDLTDAVNSLQFGFLNGLPHHLIVENSDEATCVRILGCDTSLKCEEGN